MKVTIVGDYASQSFLNGRELERRDYEVEYFLQFNKYTNQPPKYHRLGSIQGNLLINYIQTGFWMTYGRVFKKSEIQMINGTYPKCSKSDKICYSYHGSDLRLGTVKPQLPSFVSLRELLDYSKGSVFLPRVADDKVFIPRKEIKEKKEAFKQAEGIDFMVGHFAHSPHIKGSDLLETAIKEINETEDIEIHYHRLTVPRKEMVEKLNLCDLVLDHVNPKTGKTYNVVSIEALMCEVPVASYFEKDYLDYKEMEDIVGYLDPEPEQLKKSLLNILKQQQKIDRKRIIKLHSSRSVVDKLLQTWKEWEFI